MQCRFLLLLLVYLLHSSILPILYFFTLIQSSVFNIYVKLFSFNLNSMFSPFIPRIFVVIHFNFIFCPFYFHSIIIFQFSCHTVFSSLRYKLTSFIFPLVSIPSPFSLCQTIFAAFKRIFFFFFINSTCVSCWLLSY